MVECGSLLSPLQLSSAGLSALLEGAPQGQPGDTLILWPVEFETAAEGIEWRGYFPYPVLLVQQSVYPSAKAMAPLSGPSPLIFFLSSSSNNSFIVTILGWFLYPPAHTYSLHSSECQIYVLYII